MTSARPFVLIAVADADESRPLPSLTREGKQIREALMPLVESGVLDPTQTIPDATAEDIVKEFQRAPGRICILHFAGHANSAGLLLAGIDGGSATAPAETLAGFLGVQEGLSLVFLNACSTEKHVELLRKHGKAAVVATSRDIRDQAATELATNFYTELVKEKLHRAFEKATKATLLTHGGELRGLTGAPSQAPDKGPPWRLEPPDSAWSPIPDPKKRHDEVREALATMYYEARDARRIAMDAGYPAAQLPAFSTPLIFWTLVLEAAANGRLKGGIQPIVDAAAADTPHHEVFERYCSR